MKDFKPVSRKEDIVIQELEDEVLVYDLVENKAFCLNQTSAEIWRKCDGTRSIAGIADELREELDSSVSENYVLLAIEQLEKNNLLVTNSEPENFFNNMSRREMIQKVGLSSMIALPIVSSLIAPKAVMAQSCAMTPLSNGCPCTSNGSCNSGCCAPSPNGCVTPNSLSVGTPCRANCNCVGNCCGFGNVCATVGGTADGNPCRVNCECASGSCSGGTCVASPFTGSSTLFGY